MCASSVLVSIIIRIISDSDFTMYTYILLRLNFFFLFCFHLVYNLIILTQSIKFNVINDENAAGSHNLRQCFIVLEYNFSVYQLILPKNVDVEKVIDQRDFITCQANIWPMTLPEN